MGDDKKIKQDLRIIIMYLAEIEKLSNRLEDKKYEKKVEKYNKVIENDKKRVEANVYLLIEHEGKFTDIKPDSENQQQILRELFPDGTDAKSMAIDKEIKYIKKLINVYLKECMEECSYDSAAPIEERIKNELFDRERRVGNELYKTGDPFFKKFYCEDWNYTRDYETTKDKYFTKEEQSLLEKCWDSGIEGRNYYKSKRKFIADMGAKLIDSADRMNQWADKKQAKIWAERLSKEIFPQVVDETCGKLLRNERDRKAREMTRRYITFVNDPKAVEEAQKEKMALMDEFGSELNETKKSIQNVRENANGLIGVIAKKKLDGIEEDIDENTYVILFDVMLKNLGMEKTIFITLYDGTESKEETAELLSLLTDEELGL